MNSTPALANSALNVVATETEIEDRVDGHTPVAAALAIRGLRAVFALRLRSRAALSRSRSGYRASRRCAGSRGRCLPATSAHPSSSAPHSSRCSDSRSDRTDLGPFRLVHGLPALESVEPPRQHPFRLILFRRDETHGVFGKALGRLFRFNQRLKSVLVLIDVDAPDLLDGLLHCRHSSLRSRFQGPPGGFNRVWRCSGSVSHPMLAV